MRRILVLCPYPQGIAAGQRLKYEQYLDNWRVAGFDVTVSSFMDRALWDRAYAPGHGFAKALGTLRGHLRRLWDLARIHRYDIVYISMWVTPFGTSWLERLARKRARAIVYDIEDNLLADEGAPRGLRQRLKGRGKARYLLEHADHVLTASPFMVDRYRAINALGAVTLIYPSVDTDVFRPRYTPSQAAKPVIGWTGTFSSRPYLDLLRPIFQELARRVDYKLIVIGNFSYDLPGVDLEVLSWSRKEEVAQMQRLDIGVYPLPDDDWVLGKAGLKVIQYMAFGLPSVSSAIGTATQQVTDGIDGFLVDTPEQWLATLERLCRDPDLRRRIGDAGRHEAVARYSRQATSGQYLDVLNMVSGL
ncbi:glycosyltransferase involved in cell wall biosynthesis [Sphingomonas aurantiaca]|uniref:Glycosyltransferase involved in cell wall biosynthesis n=1 Tax=Sphingomonas aurantiaca TaxID=185949 RepID=A0A2T5GG28_9SPHN|nr:glycosyltransferase family 4 protein [Sphingomonas aurantiaca]PTQ58282.1 glycosyltransferase involved in cell wall biosynthesis [Sphingomonas aurantiaca]